MVTKAELEAELELLRRELAEAREKAPGPRAPAPDAPEEAGARDMDEGDGEEAARTPEQAIAEILKAHGLDAADLDGLAGQLADELGELMGKRPALTAISIFALGFVLGRLSK